MFNIQYEKRSLSKYYLLQACNWNRQIYSASICKHLLDMQRIPEVFSLRIG